MLFLLGIDSAFSFLEAFLTAFQDAERFKKWDRKVLTFVIAAIAFLFSLMYATDAGLIWLDTIDYYINFVMCKFKYDQLVVSYMCIIKNVGLQLNHAISPSYLQY